MKKGSGSNKGSSFERELCKRFSLWVSKGKRDDLFWRTAGSGARATTRRKGNKTTENSSGDMMCLAQEGSWLLDCFTFEFKRGYNSWRVSDFLLKKECELFKIWEKIDAEAKAENKIPVLILKQDRRDSLLFSLPSFFDNQKHMPVLKGTIANGKRIWAIKLHLLVPRLPKIIRTKSSNGKESAKDNFQKIINK